MKQRCPGARASRPLHWSLGAALIFSVAATVSAQVGDRAEIDRTAPPEHWETPDGKPRPPEETVSLFELPPGFRVEVVAAEPLIQDPIAIQFDERGRLWALEWPSYNWKLRDVLGLESRPAPKSRVVVLEDTDGDGRMDKRTVFMDGIEWPRGLLVSRDGALVFKLPEIVMARDTNGDGRADEEKVLVSGLEIPANPHNALNTLLRGIDNWIYPSKLPQRFRLTERGWETRPFLSLRGQWGLSQDNYGRLFYASNGDHLRGDLVPGHYFTRNPNFPVTAGVDVKYPEDQYTWPHRATPGVNRRAQLRDENGTLQSFTANTGPCVYRGDQFPRDYAGNVFLGDVAGRFLRRSVLTETDGAMTARNAHERREFLFSRDERFRPVFTSNGPDGALYVVDMHRGIIEGEIFVTSFLRQQIVKRALQQPFHGMGRIYRIVHTSGRAAPAPRVRVDDVGGWVAHLAHPNGFWRDTAQKLLIERGDQGVLPAVRTLARESPDELGRLHALWTVEGLQGVDAPLVIAALADPSPKIRVAALRISEPLLGNRDVARAVAARADDARLEVRRQLLLTLGESRDDELQRVMLAVAQRDAGHPVTVEAALSGWQGREAALLTQLFARAGKREKTAGAERLAGALAHAIVNCGEAEALGQLSRLVANDAASPQWLRLALLDGAKAAQKKPAGWPAGFAPLEKSSDELVRARALALKKAWTAPAAAAARPARALTGPIFERGREVYAVCAACHGPEGKGNPELAPALENSKVVAAATADEVLRSVVQGRNLDRANRTFPDMPPLGGLPDEDIAAVVSYVRARWGGATRPVTIGQVAKARAAAGG